MKSFRLLKLTVFFIFMALVAFSCHEDHQGHDGELAKRAKQNGQWRFENIPVVFRLQHQTNAKHRTAKKPVNGMFKNQKNSRIKESKKGK